MATVSYDFKIGNDTIKYSESTIITIDDVQYSMSLLSLRYHKKMFQPGKIEAKLLIKQNVQSNTKAPDTKSLVNYFKTQKNDVNLSKTVDGKETKVAVNYYVYKVLPEYKRNDAGQYVNVKLDIYSPDHKLTLDRFCRAYTNQKLANDVFANNISESGSILAKAGFKKETLDISHLRFLRYIVNNKDNKLEFKEFIQPYLVQYNESFYDFIARTANRCGEFFYYEDGKLYLGINDFRAEQESDSNASEKNNEDWVDIDRDLVLSYSFSQADEKLVDTFRDYHGSIWVVDDDNKEKPRFAASEFTYDNEVPLDEYLHNFVKADSYTSKIDEFFPRAWKNVTEALGALFTGGPAGLVAWAVPTVLVGLLFAESVAKSKNDLFNKKWVGDDTTPPTKNGNNNKDRLSPKKDSSSLFGSYTENYASLNYEHMQNIDQKLYTFIGTGSKSVSENLIDITLSSEDNAFRLGQQVTFESKSDAEAKKSMAQTDDKPNYKKYVVIEVSEVYKAEAKNMSQEEWQVGEKVTIAPLYAMSVKKNGSGTLENFELPCPPVMCPLIRKSSPQRAVITNNVDPMGYGRVQVKYHWQTGSSTADSSPLIRQAVPYVPNTSAHGGGFYFQLGINTEVLVDYDNGNIERPFVIGCLYGDGVKAPRDRYNYTGGWSPTLHPDEPAEPLVICSKKGHRIKFDDNGNLEDFLMGASPAIELTSLAWKHLPFSSRIDQEGTCELTGGTTIEDKWGIYKIACNTTKRSVSVSSPFGTVDINAFTGITINCPCGDITLKGKNIKLEAGNEISIHSGLNVTPPGYSTFRDTVLKGAANALLDKFVLPLVDFRLIRTTLEIFLKPVAGTLTLKSNRYLLLGAGLGKPEIPTMAYSEKGLHKKVYHDERGRLHRQLCYMNSVIDKFFSSFVESYKNCRNETAEVLRKLDPDGNVEKQRKDYVKAAFSKGKVTRDNLEFRPFTDTLKQQSIVDYANKRAKHIQELKKMCEDMFSTADSMDFGLDGMFKPGTFKKVLSSQTDLVPDLIHDVQIGSDLFLKTDENLQAVYASRKAVKRNLMYIAINGTYGVEYVKPKLGEAVKFSNVKDFEDDKKWLSWVTNLHKYTGKSILANPVSSPELEWTTIHKWGWSKVKKGAQAAKGPIARFGLEVLDESLNKASQYNPIAPFLEKDTWGLGQKGEILMSDKEGHDTLNIVNGGINRTENSDGYTNKIRALLSTIY